MDEWERYRIFDRGGLSDDVFARLLRRCIEARERGELPPRPDARITREAARIYAEHRGLRPPAPRRDGLTVRWALTSDVGPPGRSPADR